MPIESRGSKTIPTGKVPICSWPVAALQEAKSEKEDPPQEMPTELPDAQ
jgi:hypothetical protein